MHSYALGCITMHTLVFPWFSLCSLPSLYYFLPGFYHFFSGFYLLFTVCLHNYASPTAYLPIFNCHDIYATPLSRPFTPSELPTYYSPPKSPSNSLLDPLNAMLSTYTLPSHQQTHALPTRVAHQTHILPNYPHCEMSSNHPRGVGDFTRP